MPFTGAYPLFMGTELDVTMLVSLLSVG